MKVLIGIGYELGTVLTAVLAKMTECFQLPVIL